MYRKFNGKSRYTNRHYRDGYGGIVTQFAQNQFDKPIPRMGAYKKKYNQKYKKKYSKNNFSGKVYKNLQSWQDKLIKGAVDLAVKGLISALI